MRHLLWTRAFCLFAVASLLSSAAQQGLARRMATSLDDMEGAREPLLEPAAGPAAAAAATGAAPPAVGHRQGSCSTTEGVANLVTTAVGAGMVALPRAVSGGQCQGWWGSGRHGI